MEILHPEPIASSGWSEDQMRGMAVSGALARATERVLSGVGIERVRPSRVTIDLFKPALMIPTIIETKIVRRGRRLCLIDATCIQAGAPVARSITLCLQGSGTPSGAVWSPDHDFAPPPPELKPESDDLRLYFSEETGWTITSAAPASAVRRRSWHFGMPIVVGEIVTPFQMAVCVADVTNVVCNWGAGGLQFINADVTVALSRLPIELQFGLSAIDRSEADGISVGTAALFDRHGVFGTTTILGLANSQRAVDPRTSARIAGQMDHAV